MAHCHQLLRIRGLEFHFIDTSFSCRQQISSENMWVALKILLFAAIVRRMPPDEQPFCSPLLLSLQTLYHQYFYGEQATLNNCQQVSSVKHTKYYHWGGVSNIAKYVNRWSILCYDTTLLSRTVSIPVNIKESDRHIPSQSTRQSQLAPSHQSLLCSM